MARRSKGPAKAAAAEEPTATAAVTDAPPAASPESAKRKRRPRRSRGDGDDASDDDTGAQQQQQQTAVAATSSSPEQQQASPKAASKAKAEDAEATMKEPEQPPRRSRNAKEVVPEDPDAPGEARAKREYPPRQGGIPVNVTVADNVAPACLGITTSALSRDGTRLAAARSNGSLAVYRVLPLGPVKKRIFNFAMIANTGGSPLATNVLAMTFLGESDEFVVAAFASGALMLYHTAGLRPVAAVPRAGGLVRSIARSGPTDFFAACSDGSTRRYALNDDADGLAVAQTLPKVSGCERALSVAVCPTLDLVIVGDDARTVTAWELRPLTERLSTQKWNLQLPNCYPLCIACDQRTVAVGTSLNQVVFIDPLHGVVVNTFEHHKGPVTAITAAAGVFYASGWHESLRAYRAAGGIGARRRRRAAPGEGALASEYAPAEVKRRTHYHECTSLHASPEMGLFVSTARDGTIMHCNLEFMFRNPGTYVDSQVSRVAFTLSGGDLLFTHRDAAVEIYRVLPHVVLPLTTYGLNGDENIRGIHVNSAGTRVVVATDTRVCVLTVSVNRETNQCDIRRIANAPVPSVNAATHVSDDACLLASGNAIVTLRYDEESQKAALLGAKKSLARSRVARSRMAKDDVVVNAARATSIAHVFTAPEIEGSITALTSTADGPVFYATEAPTSIGWLTLDPETRDTPSDIAYHSLVDAVLVSKHALGADPAAADEVAFLNATDQLHYTVNASRIADGPVPMVKETHPMPQSAVVVGKATEEGEKNAAHVAYFPNALINMRADATKWNYTREADRAKAAPNSIKPRTEFAAFVSKATPALWSHDEAGAAAVKAQQTLDNAETRGQKKRLRAEAAARKEIAALTLDGDIVSDHEGSDDDVQRVAAASAAGGALNTEELSHEAANGVFVLRRNIHGLLEGLPEMWRVRRFGN